MGAIAQAERGKLVGAVFLAVDIAGVGLVALFVASALVMQLFLSAGTSAAANQDRSEKTLKGP
jgi:hypothetical protein